MDVRTVAGRLGHGGGGTSTLRFYSAFVSESDQRAVARLAGRMPHARRRARYRRVSAPYPFEELADTLQAAIETGQFAVGCFLSGQKVLAAEYGVSVSTAHRAAAEPSKRGFVEVVTGHGWKILELPAAEPAEPPKAALAEPVSIEAVSIEPVPIEPVPAGPALNDLPASSPMLLDLAIRHRGEVIARLSTQADPGDGEELRDLLLDAVLRRGGVEDQISEYEMELRRSGTQELIITFVASRRRRV